MPQTNAAFWYLDDQGVLRRWMRDRVVGASKPTPPTNIKAVLSGTTVTVSYGVPTSDGGSPITGYIVKQTGGATQSVASDVLAVTFTGVSAAGTYTFTAQAVNDAGIGASASASVTVVASGGGTTTTSSARFPGDTNPKVSGKTLFGIDEADKNPEVMSGAERAAPENITKIRAAAIRYYYTGGWGQMAVPNGAIATDHRNQAAKGRIAWPSFTVSTARTGDNWAQATDGTNNATADAFIAWAEESATAPIPFAFNHEPDFTTTAGTTADDYGLCYRWFRSRMDAYAAANGGVGVYKWKQLSLGPIMMAQDYAVATSKGAMAKAWPGAAQITATASSATDTFTSTRHFLSNGRRSKLTANPPIGFNSTTLYWVVNATANTFQLSTTRGGAPIAVGSNTTATTVTNNDVWDWVAADPYIGSGPPGIVISSTYWTTNFQKTLTWCEDPAHYYPLGLAEHGIYYKDPDAGPRFTQWFNRVMDGTHDVWVMCYFNSKNSVEEDQWYLSNNPDGVANGNLLDAFTAIMKGPKTCRFYDLTRPDGTKYVKPAGATF